MKRKVKIPLYYGELHIIIAEDFTKYGYDKSINDYPLLLNPRNMHAFSTPKCRSDSNWVAKY